MKVFTCIAAFLLFLSATSVSAQTAPPEAWTGGFWIDGNWVAVNVRFDRIASAGNADILFPTFGGAENVINVALENVKLPAQALHFEIPVRTQRFIFDGQQK